MQKVAYIPDYHFPYGNEDYLWLIRDFLQSFRPTHLAVLGDWFDFNSVSRHYKKPEEMLELQQHIDDGTQLLKEFSNGLTRNRVFHKGNHEVRLDSYVKENAPSLKTLRDLSFESLTRIDKLGYEVVEYGDYSNVGTLYATHGNTSSTHSGASARKHMENLGASVVIGHTHKLGMYHRTNHLGYIAGYEAGYLGPLKPAYEKTQQNWSNGFAVAYVDGDDHWCDLIPIRDGKFVYAGKTWKC